MHAVMHLIAELVYYVIILLFTSHLTYVTTEWAYARTHIITMLSIPFLLRYILCYFTFPNLFSWQKTIPRPRPSFKTKTETLGIKTKGSPKL